jgi:hypothetical protein
VLRKLLAPLVAAALVSALAVAPVTSSAAPAASLGQLIVRCGPASLDGHTVPIVPVDPVMTRTGPAGHNHMFFGNLKLPADGAAVVAAGTGWANLTDRNEEPPGPGAAFTNCDDVSDGSAQWFPELFYDGAPRTARHPAGSDPPCGDKVPPEYPACAIYNRVYYETMSATQAAAATYLPDRLQMMNGYPLATAPPTITSPAAASAYLVNQSWSCGSNSGVETPRSPWPYDCNLWRSVSGQLAEDGLVMLIHFPNCVDVNQANWDNFDGGPFYAAPGASTLRSNLQFASGYGGGTCPAGWQLVPQVSIRLHTLLEYYNSTTEPIFANSLTAPRYPGEGLPSCYSHTWPGRLTATAGRTCTNTAPAASDLRFGFASDAPANGAGADCTLTGLYGGVGDACGYFSGHGDYMDLWQQDNLGAAWPATATVNATLDTVAGADAPTVAFNLDDVTADCNLKLPSTKCGFFYHDSFGGY